MDRKVDSTVEIAMQQLMETHVPMRDAAEEAIDRMAEGRSPMQALFEAMLNAAMLIERERHLEARPHERAEGCQGYDEALDLIQPRRAAPGPARMGGGRPCLRRIQRRRRPPRLGLSLRHDQNGVRVLRDLQGAGVRGTAALQGRVRLHLRQMGGGDPAGRRRPSRPLEAGGEGDAAAGLIDEYRLRQNNAHPVLLRQMKNYETSCPLLMGTTASASLNVLSATLLTRLVNSAPFE